MKRIVVFASGNGSNAVNLIDHFGKGEFARVVAVFCNKKTAGVIAKAEDRNVPVKLFGKEAFYETNEVIEAVKRLNPDIIVLAGFLWLVPVAFIKAFEDRIINLHPSLLPKYGGKGMYGHHVHEAVLAAGEKETGISVHMVNREFDKGKVIRQAKFNIVPGSTVADIESEIHKLEHIVLPEAVEQFLKG